MHILVQTMKEGCRMNLTIEEKLALIQQLKNIPKHSETEKKKVQKKISVAFFFVRMTLCIALCGILFVLIEYSEGIKEWVFSAFTGECTINLIDFFAPFKYTFKR